MRWILTVLLILLLISTVAALSNEITPMEKLKVKTFDSKPVFEVPAPAIYEGKIFTIGGDGSILISFSMDGEKLWSARVGAKVSTPPLVIPNAPYGYAKNESWVVVVTDSFELKAYETERGSIRIERLRLPSAPSGAPLYYLGDSRTVIIPLKSSIQAVDLRSRSIKWSVDLGFKLEFVDYKGGNALLAGDHWIASIDLLAQKVMWKMDLGKQVVAFGSDGVLSAVLLENGTLVSVRTSTGDILGRVDMLSRLGYDVPRGKFPVVAGVAALTSSNEIIHFLDLSKLEILKTIRTWIQPVKQPSIIGKALIYFAKGGTVRVYHFTEGFLLSELKVDPPLSEVVIAEPVNHTSKAAYLDSEGYLHLLTFPDMWIKVQRVEETESGYLVEGFVCSTEVEGTRSIVKVYAISPNGEILGEKIAGVVRPGECGTRFSTLVRGKGAVGLLIDDVRLPPTVPAGMSREEWISYKPSTVTITPTETTSKPAVKPILRFKAPREVKVGDPVVVEVFGVNGWGVSELTITLRGAGIEEKETSVKVDPGSSFDLALESKALKPGKGATISVEHEGQILNVTQLPLVVSSGKVIDGLIVPSSAVANQSVEITITVVNRYMDGAVFSLKVYLDGIEREVTIGPLAAGEYAKPSIELTPSSTGDLKLTVEILASDGSVIDQATSVLHVEALGPSTTSTKPQQLQLPLPMEYLVAITAVIIIIVAAAIVLSRSRKKAPEEKPPVTREVTEVPPRVAVPPPPEVEETPPPIPEEVKKGIVEELGVEKPEEIEAKPVLPPEPEEEVGLPPMMGRKEVTEVPCEVPVEVKERLEGELRLAKERLEEIKESISKLEEIVGFELSPYRLVDAETMLISAELKLKEGEIEEAKKLIDAVKESLDVLEVEVSEAEKTFFDNWSAVENRIDIMLRVWGKAPANMLTMVPAGFRIAALERFRRLHPDRKLELRGDELIALEE